MTGEAAAIERDDAVLSAVRGDKRTIILEAATRLFAERGFDGVSMRDIATASGFRLGSLYHFYPEKGQLYERAVTAAFERCYRRLAEALEEPGPAEHRLRRMIGTVYEMFIGDEPDIRLIDREHLASGSFHVAEMVREVFTRIHAALHPIVAELSARKGLGDREIDWTTSHIFALAYGAAKLRVQHAPLLELSSETARRAFLEEMNAFILRGI